MLVWLSIRRSRSVQLHSLELRHYRAIKSRGKIERQNRRRCDIGLKLLFEAPKSSHITPILRSLHWLKITERIEYKLLSLTYKVITTNQPTFWGCKILECVM